MNTREIGARVVALAATSALGPVVGGVLLTGGAIAFKALSESEWAKSIAEMGMHLASDAASELFGCGVEAFRRGRNHDLEASMHEAAKLALTRLHTKEFDEYFKDWLHYLRARPSTEVLAGTQNLDPIAMAYDDTGYRAIWWTQMEQTLLGWRAAERRTLTPRLPEGLVTLLRENLPGALRDAHDEVLREKRLEKSWIAFQQRVHDETLNHLIAIRGQLNRIEAKIDARAPARDGLQAWTTYAETLLEFYQKPPSPAYAYGALPNAISLRGVFDDAVSIDLVPTLSRRFATETRQKPVILIGEYGQGKTSVCGAFGAALAAAFLSDATHNPIPLVIPLGELRDIYGIDDHVQSVLSTWYGLDPEAHSFSQDRRSGRFLLILDSLDEYFQEHAKMDVVFHLRRFALHTTLRTNQFLVSSRPNIFGPKDRKALSDLYDFVDIEWLAVADVRDYLVRLGLKELVDDQRLIDVLREIAARPLFLGMLSEAVRTLGVQRITSDEASFMDYYVDAWHQRDEREKRNAHGDLAKDEILSVLGKAAASMNARNSETVGERELDSLVAGNSRHSWRAELSRLQTQARDRLLLVPQFDGDNRRLTFRHACFRSYFAARNLSDAILRGDFSAVRNSKIEDLVVRFLFQLADRDEGLRNILDAWSRTLPERLDWNNDSLAAIRSMWAIRTGVPLASDHLRSLFRFLGRGAGKIIVDLMRSLGLGQLDEIDLLNVDLRGILLPKLSFNGCHISGVNLDGSVIQGLSFVGSSLESCSFQHAQVAYSTFQSGSVVALSNFAQANLPCSILKDTTISDATFARTRLSEISALRTGFTNCDFTSSDLRLSMLEDCVFSNCRLEGALFVGSRLIDCEFVDCDTESAFGLREALAT